MWCSAALLALFLQLMACICKQNKLHHILEATYKITLQVYVFSVIVLKIIC